MYYWVQRPTSITHQKVNPRYIDRADSYYLCLQNIPKENTVYRGCCLGKAFQDDNQTLRYHASNTPYQASGTPYSEKTKKANSQRVPEKTDISPFI